MGKFSDTLFQSINFNTSKVDSRGTIFLISVLHKSEYYFKCKFVQWHFNVFSDIFYSVWRLNKKLKVASCFVHNSKCLFMQSIIVF